MKRTRKNNPFPFNFFRKAEGGLGEAAKNSKEMDCFLGTLAPARVGVAERHHEPQCVRGGIETPRAPRVVIIVCFQNGFEQRLVVHRQESNALLGVAFVYAVREETVWETILWD